MRRDYGDFKTAMDTLIARVESGAWRHGIKTKDAVGWLLRIAKFPSDANAMWSPRFKRRCGEFLAHALYYWVQGNFKNRRFTFEGDSGQKYRLRRIHSVEHGNGDGQLVHDGEPLKPDKEGLWMRDEDMHQADVRLVRGTYTGRRADSIAQIRYLDAADDALQGKPADTVVGDVRDAIARAM